ARVRSWRRAASVPWRMVTECAKAGPHWEPAPPLRLSKCSSELACSPYPPRPAILVGTDAAQTATCPLRRSSRDKDVRQPALQVRALPAPLREAAGDQGEGRSR